MTGRPPLPKEERRVLISIRLPPSMVEWLRGQPGGITATIERLIEDEQIKQRYHIIKL